MSAASPKTQDKTQDKAAEPSMEEILASIRRIIADDQAVKPSEAAPVRAAPPVPENDDVLDLAEIAEPVRRPEPAPKPAPIEADPIDFADEALDFDAIEVEPEFDPPVAAAPEPRREPPPAAEPRAELPDPFDDAPVERLTSSSTDASVSQAFNMLAHTVLSQNTRTLEDLVKDMLRPMLKAWLDDNLPVMVERLVRAEIERVSRGR
ncbi:PopZ family protein [Methylobacterium nigriterrae]|uniref:PopZ family protein n=1 Tax=Methylobacterium nigriterrae TaxID=3127512 RepID=UPI003013F16D